jgi:class 3 adenylate cyclase
VIAVTPYDSHSMPSGGTLTVLFTDLVGSTSLMTELGPERFDALLAEHDGIVVAAISAHGGERVKHTGDGVMAVFGRAVDGLDAAVAIQQAVERRNRRAEIPFTVRAGLSVGDVTEKDGDYFGPAPVEAARLCALVDGGRIYATDIVRALAGARGDHEFLALGALELKGLPTTPAVEVRWEPKAMAVVPLPPGLVVDGVPLCGREPETIALVDAWDAMPSGATRVLLVSGEPGIGKTRLAAEIAGHVNAGGGTVLLGRCDEQLGAPYAPVVEALRPLLAGVTDAEIIAWTGNDTGSLVRLFPELRARMGEPDDTQRADAETERLRLFESIRRILAGAAADTPILLVLDDLHWADTSTALLLRHLARANDVARVMVLGTARERELDPNGVLADTPLQRVPLTGLGSTGIEALVGALGSGRLNPDQFADADGNPFFLRELVAHALERGSTDLPAGVRDVIDRRLARLSEPTQRTLGAAAVVGREFALALLAAVTGDGEDVVLDRLAEAEASGLIAEIGDTVGRFTFSHALVRATLLDRLGPTRRLRLHQRTGAQIEASGIDDVVALALHYLEAAPLGTASSGVLYARRAARLAIEQSAPEDALTQLERTLAVLDHVDDPHGLIRCEVLTELAELKGFLFERDASRALATEAVGLARAARSAHHVTAAVVVYASIPDYASGDLETLNAIDDALEIVGPSASADRARLLAWRSRWLYVLRRESEPVARDAVAVARTTGDATTIYDALDALAVSLMSIGRPAEALECRQEAVTYSTRIARLNPFTGWGARDIVPYLMLGDRATFERCVAEFAATMRDRFRTQERLADRWRRMLALLDGHFDDAKQIRNPTIANDSGSAAQLMESAAQSAIRRESGDLDRLADRFARTLPFVPGIPSVRAGYAEVLAELDRFDDALEQLEELAPADFATLGWNIGRPLALRDLAETIARLDHRAHAATLHPQLAVYDGQVIVSWMGSSCEGAAARGLGQLETVLGRYDEAEAHYLAAIALEERIGGRVCLPRTKYWYARMLLARHAADDADRAAALLDDVIAETSTLGMRALEAQARAIR